MQEEKRFHVYWFSLAALGLALLATWLRWWRLASVPPGLWFDEGFNAMEAVWMLKTQNWPIFIMGGQGREVLFHYLLALFIGMLGQTVYVVRFVSTMLGVLTIPLMYCWGLTIFKGETHGRWVALISTAGLTVSLWYLVMNRVGYRANTFLPVFLLTSYFFWRGWQSGKFRFYFMAGLWLGLCQYTYLASRLVPLVFIVFGVAATLLHRKHEQPARLKTLWLGLLIMAAVAVLVVAPMLYFFVDYPELFWERGGDVSFKLDWSSSEGLTAFAKHILSAGRVFIDGQDPNWRHHLQGRSVFDGLSILGFLTGIVVIFRQYRRPRSLFLLATLFVMWLPALLSEPAFHTLRLVGILPVYYVMMALGLLSITNWIILRLSIRIAGLSAGAVTLAIVLLVSGGITYYSYFYRWARMPEVYQAFDGQVMALAQKLINSEEVDLVIPFYLYAHPSMRYLLYC